ncbi:hypothetical protein [Nocardia sp. NPDC003345]
MEHDLVVRSRLRLLLEQATGGSGTEHDVYATVKFTHGVVTAQRVSMWATAGGIRLGSWVGELKPQYVPFYSNPTAIEGLLALEDRGWTVAANLHLAYHNARPFQRWYPPMASKAREYTQRWSADLEFAGRRPREVIADPAFGHWLVDRGHITPAALPGLRDWLDGHSRKQIDIRPSIAIERPLNGSSPGGADFVSVRSVRTAIDEFLTAIHEPPLK